MPQPCWPYTARKPLHYHPDDSVPIKRLASLVGKPARLTPASERQVSLVAMALPLPASLTPSKVAAFKDCALAFRFSVIDGLPEPPNEQAFKGTVVHRALELLMWEEPQGQRSLAKALGKLDRAVDELSAGPEAVALGLSGERLLEFIDDARWLVRNYFELEDPNSIRVIGTELFIQAEVEALPRWGPEDARSQPVAELTGLAAVGEGPPTQAGQSRKQVFPRPGPAGSLLRLRGIIDRLELDANGELVVTDYKTGRAPGEAQEQTRLGGVHFYAFLCEKVLGRRPARVQLLHLREPLVVVATPSDQSVAGLEIQAVAIWDAIRRACLLEDFRPKPGPICERCGFHAYCPAQGGDLSLARGVTPSEKVRMRPQLAFAELAAGR
jgi:putative RecB family exonuclease